MYIKEESSNEIDWLPQNSDQSNSLVQNGAQSPPPHVLHLDPTKQFKQAETTARFVWRKTRDQLYEL